MRAFSRARSSSQGGGYGFGHGPPSERTRALRLCATFVSRDGTVTFICDLVPTLTYLPLARATEAVARHGTRSAAHTRRRVLEGSKARSPELWRATYLLPFRIRFEYHAYAPPARSTSSLATDPPLATIHTPGRPVRDDGPWRVRGARFPLSVPLAASGTRHRPRRASFAFPLPFRVRTRRSCLLIPRIVSHTYLQGPASELVRRPLSNFPYLIAQAGWVR
ncbi:hypothetical protein C8Q80DRAFT_341733 [Daedaleopsis nitida]|nr:hypothetical protein C8Q80DRAFT_341733 [Daedaleopsis nitida]